MKDTRDVLREIGWSEQLIDAILVDRTDSPTLPSIGDDFAPTIVSTTDVPAESIELNLSGGDGVIFKT